jgi:ethanolamine utilization microcompartment shell protein EutL
VVFARSFYAGSAHASGRCRARSSACWPRRAAGVEDGLAAVLRCLAHDACFYDADGKRGVTVFPHVIGSLGHYLARPAGLPVGERHGLPGGAAARGHPRLDAALKAADVRAVKIVAAADRDQLRVRLADRQRPAISPRAAPPRRRHRRRRRRAGPTRGSRRRSRLSPRPALPLRRRRGLEPRLAERGRSTRSG